MAPQTRAQAQNEQHEQVETSTSREGDSNILQAMMNQMMNKLDGMFACLDRIDTSLEKIERREGITRVHDKPAHIHLEGHNRQPNQQPIAQSARLSDPQPRGVVEKYEGTLVSSCEHSLDVISPLNLYSNENDHEEQKVTNIVPKALDNIEGEKDSEKRQESEQQKPKKSSRVKGNRKMVSEEPQVSEVEKGNLFTYKGDVGRDLGRVMHEHIPWVLLMHQDYHLSIANTNPRLPSVVFSSWQQLGDEFFKEMIHGLSPLEGIEHRTHVKKVDEWKTVFITMTGWCDWFVRPFGPNDIPSTFTRFLHHMPCNCVGEFVVVYVDDLLVCSYRDSVNEHARRLAIVLGILMKDELCAKIAKCIFGVEDLVVLSLIIGKQEVEEGEEKFE